MMAAPTTIITTCIIPATPTLYVGVVMVATTVLIPGIKETPMQTPTIAIIKPDIALIYKKTPDARSSKVITIMIN